MRDALAEFRQLQAARRLTPEICQRLSTAAASAFLAHHRTSGGYLQDAITLLCDIATLDDETLAKPGLTGLFPLLVERLSDSFNPAYCPLYDRMFAQVVEFCRHLPAGQPLDAELRRFGLHSEQDLLKRKAALKGGREKFDARLKARARKVFVLSRVTLGAEVAVTSVVLAKMKWAFPNAELVLVAPAGVRDLFAGDRRVRVHPIQYERNGGLVERLNSWLEVVEAIDDERRGLDSEAYLVVDPDSRLTQLGLLPVVDDESRYNFFESRSHREPGIGCISQLIASWLNDRFGAGDDVVPYVSLRAADIAFGQRLGQALRASGMNYLVSINLGVGGNPRKRLPDPFEERLLSSLLDDGAGVILAKGVNAEERDRVNRLIARLREQGRVVAEADQSNAAQTFDARTFRADVVTVQVALGAYCGLIAASDAYIGYDSAGQHIAAALGIPTLDIFADTSNPLITERWRPCGKGVVKVVVVDPARPEHRDLDATLGVVMAAHREICQSRSAKSRHSQFAPRNF